MSRILIVDDEAMVLSAMTRRLARTDHECVSTFGGISALPMLRMFNESYFDLILSDIDMPGMNGIEFAIACRERYPEIPFVLMTGGDLGRARRAGLTDVPVYDKLELASSLAEIIEKHARKS